MGKIFRKQLEQACADNIRLDSRFGYHFKSCIGEGGYGIVYQEPVKGDSDVHIVQKVNGITSRPVRNKVKRGIVPLEMVRYEGEGKVGNIILNEDELVILRDKELFPLQSAVAEYQNLRILQGLPYFPQVVAQQWSSEYSGDNILADREFFLLDGRLCVRAIRTKVPGDELEQIIERGIQPLDVVKVAYDMAHAIKILGKNNIVHRDIKPGNVVYNYCSNKEGYYLPGCGDAYLIDFGTSVHELGDEVRGKNDDIYQLLSRHTKSVCGTNGYIAPEVLLGDKATNDSDKWSLGCLLYKSITGKLPFADLMEAATYNEKMDFGLLYKEMIKCYPGYDSFVEAVGGLFAQNPEERRLEPVILEAAEILYKSRLNGSGLIYMPMHNFEGYKTNIPDTVKVTSLDFSWR